MKKYSKKDYWLACILGMSPIIIIGFVLSTLKNPLAWDDSLRHFTIANIMLHEGSAIGWDRFFYAGILSQHTVDPWFLANVFYIPFTLLGIGNGLILYAIVSMAFVAYCFHLLVKDIPISPYIQALLVALLLIGDEMFLVRSLLSRPFMAFVGLFLLMIYQLKKKQWGHIGILMAISVLYSQLFVFQLLLGGVLFVTYYIYKQENDAAMLVLSLVCGTIIGFLLHPHTFQYLQYMQVFLRIPTMSASVLGTEMSSGIFGSITSIAIIGYVILHLCAYAMLHKKTWRHAISSNVLYVFLLVLTLIFGCMYILWMRAIDFLWPITLLLLAYTLALFPVQIAKTKSEKKLLRVGMLCIIFFGVFHMSTNLYTLLHTDNNRRAAVMKVMDQIDTGSNVLNPEWFMFFPLFAARPDVQYATGIDNTFTHLWDQDAAEYLDLLQGKTFKQEKPIVNATQWLTQLLEYFPDSDYLVLSKSRNKNFIPELMNIDSLEPIFDNGESIVAVFKIKK